MMKTQILYSCLIWNASKTINRTDPSGEVIYYICKFNMEFLDCLGGNYENLNNSD